MVGKVVKPLMLLACLAGICVATAPARAQEKREPESPAISLDGRRIVYLAGVIKAGEVLPSTREVWLVNVDGTGARRLTTGATDWEPRLSPDGNRIVFRRDGDLWLIEADGSGLRNLTNTRDHNESNAHFTGDGQSLVFLRLSPDDMDEKTKAEILRESPLAALGMDNVQSVVLRNLQTGAERKLLGDGYGVEQIEPSYWDQQVVFIICKERNDGKPAGALNFRKVVAVLKFDGSSPQTVAHLKDNKITLHGLRIRPHRNVVAVSFADKVGIQTGLLQDGQVEVLKDAPALGDVTADGNTLVSTGYIDNKLNRGIVLYDIATGKKTVPGQVAMAAAQTPVGSGAGAAESTTPLPAGPQPATATRAVGEIPKAATTHFDRARDLFNDDDYAAAIAEFSKAIDAYPQYAEAYRYRGWSHSLNDDRPAALRDLAEAIRIDPKLAGAYITRAQIHEDAGDFAEAMKDYTAAIAADGRNYLGYEYRGELYASRKEWKAAIADFTEALKIYDKNLSAILARADAHTALGDHASAVENLSLALRHYPDFEPAFRKRAAAYRALGRIADAVADEKKAEELALKPAAG